MIRHLDSLNEKAATHVVYSNGKGGYIVKSGSSGTLYAVDLMADRLHYTCTCEWEEYNPGTECSHILAVRMFELK